MFVSKQATQLVSRVDRVCCVQIQSSVLAKIFVISLLNIKLILTIQILNLSRDNQSETHNKQTELKSNMLFLSMLKGSLHNVTRHLY